MNYRTFTRRPLLIAVACATPCFVIGWMIVTRASGSWASAVPALCGMGLFAVGAIIVAPFIAGWITEPRGYLYSTSGHADYSAPMYGMVDALRLRGDYKGAMDYLDHVIKSNPHEYTAYVTMIDIALVDLHDLPTAEAIYHRGTHALKNDGDKAALTVMYQALTSRHRDPAHSVPARTYAPPSRSRASSHHHRPPPAPPSAAG